MSVTPNVKPRMFLGIGYPYEWLLLLGLLAAGRYWWTHGGREAGMAVRPEDQRHFQIFHREVGKSPVEQFGKSYVGAASGNHGKQDPLLQLKQPFDQDTWEGRIYMGRVFCNVARALREESQLLRAQIAEAPSWKKEMPLRTRREWAELGDWAIHHMNAPSIMMPDELKKLQSRFTDFDNRIHRLTPAEQDELQEVIRQLGVHWIGLAYHGNAVNADGIKGRFDFKGATNDRKPLATVLHLRRLCQIIAE